MSDTPRQDTSCPICGCKETEIILADGAFMLRCPGCLSDTAGWPRIDANAMINRQAKLTPSPDVAGLVERVQSLRSARHEYDDAPASELLLLDAVVEALSAAGETVQSSESDAVQASPNVAGLVKDLNTAALRDAGIGRFTTAERVRKAADALASLSAQLKEKEAECAGLREDAERYRFLAECDLFGIHYEYGEAQRWLDSRTELDAAIDARKESK